jgi:hypothetical protein
MYGPIAWRKCATRKKTTRTNKERRELVEDVALQSKRRPFYNWAIPWVTTWILFFDLVPLPFGKEGKGRK